MDTKQLEGTNTLIEDRHTKISSLINSSCDSKGLPYNTELAFEEVEESDKEEGIILREGKLEDRFNVLEQIEEYI